MTANELVKVKPLKWTLGDDLIWHGSADAGGRVLQADTLQGAEVLERRRAARILEALDLSAVEALQAENARLREQIERLHRDIASGAMDPKC